jgi:hypothetical protein
MGMGMVTAAGDHFCGCCGRDIRPPSRGRRVPIDSFWCVRCEDHVLDDGAPWDRTYEASTGRPCPYQVARA